jgi:eukaryotic-like serine/threonine-protein kinase
MLRTGETLDGRYEIGELLAAGGMGEVYRARRVLLGDEVVIKVIRTAGGDADRMRERFMRESQLCAKLRHPNIVTILDFAIAADGQPYLVMEYLNGPSLRELLAKGGPMPVGDVQLIVGPLCGALRLAHDAGVVHRDLKPGNIVSHRFESGEVVFKVIDFGLASLREGTDDQLPVGDEFMGTVVYASPEQLEAQPLDARTDIYSLGIVVFEMLTGRPPFEASSALGVVTKQLCDAPPALSQVHSPVPGWLDDAVGKALAKDPAERWQTMADFARALTPGNGGSGPPEGARAVSALEGKYDIGPVIAAGRLGSQVHLATHRALALPVAIRLLRRQEGHDWEAVRARFLREARGLQVSHPSVIQVRDFGEERDMLYIVTDMIDGPSLLRVIQEEAPLAWERVHRLGTQLIDATVAAHRRNVLVCGLNPGIIRMTTDEEGERLLISTGGISQVQELLASLSDSALRGGDLGSAEMPYIAPEVLSGRPADVRSDIFTIGALLFEMATGRAPFAGRALPELLGAMLGAEAPDPRVVHPGVPSTGGACLLQCLARDPAARFATAAALRAAWRSAER